MDIKPKVFYNSFKEYLKIQDEIFICLHSKINEQIYSEWNHMNFMGLTPRQEINIADHLTDCLEKLTKDKTWSSKNAWEIMVGIKGFIEGMQQSNVWDKFWKLLNKQQMADIIYNNIIWQLDNNILEDTQEYRCYKCEKNVDWTNEESNFCNNCDQN